MENEEKVINIPEFLRKNRDGKKNNLEEKQEVNFEEYTEEELLEMSSKLDSELGSLDEHKKELEEERFRKTVDEIEIAVKERKELINQYRELQKELGENDIEFETYDCDRIINIDSSEKSVEGITREELESYPYDTLLNILDEIGEENNEIELRVNSFKDRIKAREEELEAKKKARRDSLIAEVREKMDKKKELEESIKKIERHLRN